jgi:hypothetical protein
MHTNGMALELYGQGMALGPDVGRGSSYWQKEHGEYYRSFPAHNTVIVDGISHYDSNGHFPFQLLHLDPLSESQQPISKWVSFSDTAFNEPKTNADQRRLISIVRTSLTSGYYIDIFRSRRQNGQDGKHEYLYHNLGQRVELRDESNNTLDLQPTDELSTEQGDQIGYNYFTTKKQIEHNKDFTASFQVKLSAQPDVEMSMWVAGNEDRTLFTAMSPMARTTIHGSAPSEISELPVPMVLVRQLGEAWTSSFDPVFEPFNETDSKTISSIRKLNGKGDCVVLIVESEHLNKRVETIFNDTGMDSLHTVEGQTFQGIYGVSCTDATGLQYLYLGHGKTLSAHGFEITAVYAPVSACLYREDGELRISTSGPVQIKTPERSHTIETCQAHQLIP